MAVRVFGCAWPRATYHEVRLKEAVRDRVRRTMKWGWRRLCVTACDVPWSRAEGGCAWLRATYHEAGLKEAVRDCVRRTMKRGWRRLCVTVCDVPWSEAGGCAWPRATYHEVRLKEAVRDCVRRTMKWGWRRLCVTVCDVPWSEAGGCAWPRATYHEVRLKEAVRDRVRRTMKWGWRMCVTACDVPWSEAEGGCASVPHIRPRRHRGSCEDTRAPGDTRYALLTPGGDTGYKLDVHDRCKHRVAVLRLNSLARNELHAYSVTITLFRKIIFTLLTLYSFEKTTALKSE